jgi:hypothetical protein
MDFPMVYIILEILLLFVVCLTSCHGNGISKTFSQTFEWWESQNSQVWTFETLKDMII